MAQFLLDNQDKQEYTAFHQVPCAKCGSMNAVKIDAWTTVVREMTFSGITLSPSIFDCNRCGMHNKLTPVFKVDLNVDLLIKEEDKEKVN